MSCTGTLQLSASTRMNGRVQTLTIAAANYVISPRHKQKVRLHLNAKGLTLLRNAHHHKIVATDFAGGAVRKVTLTFA